MSAPTIKPLPKTSKRIAVACRRCGGRGWIPCYGHVLKGICFACNGAGWKTMTRRAYLQAYKFRYYVHPSLALVRVETPNA